MHSLAEVNRRTAMYYGVKYVCKNEVVVWKEEVYLK
jgi:hypothetical protein